MAYEEFWIAYLDRANKVIIKSKVSQGGIIGTVIDVKLIMKSAIEKLSSGLILCHNHPSGNLEPSKEDLKITKQLTDAAKLFDINVIDHIIIGNNEYLSFVDEGLITR